MRIMKERNSDVAVTWIEKGLSEKDPEKKLHYFGLALELDPKNPWHSTTRACYCIRKGNFTKLLSVMIKYSNSTTCPGIFLLFITKPWH